MIILSTGLAMFSMFFGSGNLVFPLVVGQMSAGHYGAAALGIILTGVIVPILGMLAMLLFQGSRHDFLIRLGKPAAFWFPLLALSIMGPFGVLARCITVAHGSFQMLFTQTPLWAFSAGACLCLFLFSIKKNKIITLLGSILTPLLLLSLAAIVCFSVSSRELPVPVPEAGSMWPSLKTGIFQGYQTMDLLAAFFFSSFVINHLKAHKEVQDDPRRSLPLFLRASLISASLLALVYVSLVLMGAIYAPELAAVSPPEMLGFIAQKTLGSLAAPIVCATVILACFTTAIVLASLFADFLRQEVFKNRISTAFSLTATLVIAFFVSILGFSGVARIISPILEICYPALIVFTVLSIFQKLRGWKAVRLPTVAAFGIKLLSSAFYT